jgi:hypothetical protein
MAGQIKDLKARYEGESLAVYIDRKTALELIERMLKKTFARQEAAATATFRVNSDGGRDEDHDGELALPNRSIYVKLVPNGASTAEFANTYLEKVRSRNPSEYWLFAPNQEKLDIAFDPVFTEGKVTRGRLRIMGLATLISEIVGRTMAPTVTRSSSPRRRRPPLHDSFFDQESSRSLHRAIAS